MSITRPARKMSVVAQFLLSGCCLLAVAGTLLCFASPRRQNVLAIPTQPPKSQTLIATEVKSRVLANFSEVPLVFERNDGQADPQVKFLARGHGYTVFLTPSDTSVWLHGGSRTQGTHSIAASAKPSVDSVIRMQLVGASPKSPVRGEDELPGISNYFIGNEPAKWRTAIPQYARVSYHEVYRGVDLAFHGARNQLEFDLLVGPGVSPNKIAFKFSGATQLRTDNSGGLIVSCAAGDLRLHKPIAYQQNDGARHVVDAQFVIKHNSQVAIALGAYDSSKQLVIDPTVSYASYLGGTGDDQALAVAVDSAGNAYITGETAGGQFPTTLGPAFAGPPHDAFVTKLDPTKSGTASLIYSTFIGGMGDDSGNGIAVDSSGNAYIAGSTKSNNLPFTPGVFQTTLNGTQNAFVTKLGSTGTITYLTYLGGNAIDFAQGIAIDSTGNAYITGQTQSTSGFPTVNGFQTALAGGTDAFVTALNPMGSLVTYSTYLGGSATDTATAIAIDPTGKIYVTGQTDSSAFPTTGGVFQTTLAGLSNAFVSKFDPTKAGKVSLIYSTFLGGAGADSGNGIAVDSSGAAYVTGLTQSMNFPLQNPFQSTLQGIQDAFVTKLNATATKPLVYSTYLGGTASDDGLAITVDGAGNAYITGQTSSRDFPTQAPTQSALSGTGTSDAFVTELKPTGNSLAFSTFLGGSGAEDVGLFGGIAVDANNNIYVVGSTASTDFPVTNALQSSNLGGNDAFVAKITAPTPPAFTLTASAPTPNPVVKGSSATATVTANAQSGFSSTIALTCSAPMAITCSLNPTSVTPTPAAPSPTSLLTINVSSTAVLRSPKHNLQLVYALWLPVPGIVLLVGISTGSLCSRRKGWLGLLLGFLLFSGLVLQMGCGGSGSGGGGGGGGGPTPYTVNVTGSGGGQTNSVAVSGNFQ